MPPFDETPAPGARVLIRDEEWIVRNVEPCDVGGYELKCMGVSETVRQRDGIFLSAIDEVRVLDPRATDLVADDSPGFIASQLYLEARLRQTIPTDGAITLGDRAVMDNMPFQLEPARLALQQLRPRFLIADSVGLGKTLEAAILVSELMRRGKARRILVVTTKSMMEQFQQEFWTRFAIPLTRLDSAGIQRICRQLPATHNPFHFYDKTIISVDTLKRDTEYRHYLETASWDVIVIDEAHNVSFKGNRTLSNKLADLLSTRSEALILLTATPHNGDKESFASLIRMLDSTALPRKTDYTKSDIEHLFVRRFKRDVRHEIAQVFPDRRVFRFRATSTAREERAFAVLADLKLTIDDGHRTGAEMLFRTTLEKAMLSSPAACLQTVKERIRRLSARDPTHPDIDALDELRRALEAITPKDVGKLDMLCERLRSDPDWRWDPANPADRLVIFTERIETLKLLRDELTKRLGLKDNAVAVLHGQLPDTEMQDIVKAFGQKLSPLRLLIASDVASEGLNLHFQAHRLIHYDIPWSLMVFQQRNGRVDRYGQTQAPLIAYLTTETRVEKIRGDLRVLDILIAKDEQAAKNIGDPSSFMGLYDEVAEIQRVAQAIEKGESPEKFAAQMRAEDQPLDWLDALMSADSTEPRASAEVHPPQTVFASDFDYLHKAIDHLHATNRLSTSPTVDPASRTVMLQPDEELNRFLRDQLGPEMRPPDNNYALCAVPSLVKQAIESARNGDRWPELQLLWPLHPLMQWLDFKLLSLFGRQNAPVIRVPLGVAEQEALVLVSALIPNKRGQPMLNDWFAVRTGFDGIVRDSLSFEQVLEATGLGRTPIPNAGKPFDAAALQKLLPPALDHAQRRMADQHRAFSATMRERSREELSRLDGLRVQHQQQLELTFAASDERIAKLQAGRKAQEAKEIDLRFESYSEWVRSTLELDPRAHLTVAAVLIR